MGWILGFLALFCFALAIYLWQLVRLDNVAQSRLPQLKDNPAAFTAFWEQKYKRMHLRQKKNAALFLIALGLARQGEYTKAMDRMRFVRRGDPALDRDAVNALYYELLCKTGKKEESISFYKDNSASVDRGKQSPWMQ